MDEAQTQAFAVQVWRKINLPNLRQHIVHARDRADWVVRKGAGHSIETITEADRRTRERPGAGPTRSESR